MSKNFLKKYENKKRISNITIIVLAIIIAFSINFLIIDNSKTWTNLKTSILDAKNISHKADLYIEKNNSNSIILKNSKILNNIKSLSYSLIFNPEKLKIKDIKCNSNNLIKIENQAWIKAIIINYNKNINIWANTDICNINIQKENNSSQEINLINSNFTDKTGETFLLSTSWITL